MNSNPGDFANNRSEAPRHSDELLRLLLDSALEHAVFLLDRDGRVTWWSMGAERVFALPREQAIGMPLQRSSLRSTNSRDSPISSGRSRAPMRYRRTIVNHGSHQLQESIVDHN